MRYDCGLHRLARAEGWRVAALHFSRQSTHQEALTLSFDGCDLQPCMEGGTVARPLTLGVWLQRFRDCESLDQGPALDRLRCIETTFRDSRRRLRSLSDIELSRSLTALLESRSMRLIFESRIPWAARSSVLEAFPVFFRQCFAIRCTAHLCHLDNDTSEPLNRVCYMWWDAPNFMPLGQHPERDTLSDAILRVLENILAIASDPCREAALHGLGHWHLYCSSQVEHIVETFLKVAHQQQMRPELVGYAEAAAAGLVQ